MDPLGSAGVGWFLSLGLSLRAPGCGPEMSTSRSLLAARSWRWGEGSARCAQDQEEISGSPVPLKRIFGCILKARLHPKKRHLAIPTLT
jgi:hypothetical protein